MDEEEKPLLEQKDLTETLTQQKKREFLQHFANTCNVTKSSKAIGVSRVCVWMWRKNDEQFAMDFEDAKELAVEVLEDEMHRRAIDGVLKVNKHGAYREYSDTLAIFLSKAHKPEKYSERIRNEISGPNGAPLNGMDENKVISKLNTLMRTALERKQSAEGVETTPKAEEDYDDLC